MKNDLDNIIASLREEVLDHTTAFGYSLLGLRRIVAEADRWPKNSENPDPQVGWGSRDPNLVTATVMPGWKLSEFRRAVQDDGVLVQLVSLQFVSGLFATWEHVYRDLLAELLQKNRSDIKVDYFGDLRLLRNDALHHQMKAGDNTKRCKLLKWFNTGDPIAFSVANINELRELFPEDALLALI